MKYVYFIRRSDGIGPIKIGCSDIPRIRLMGCQSWSPVKITLIAEVAGGFYHEAALHDKFASTRAHGEWFNPTPELLGLIDAINAGKSLDDLGIEPLERRTNSTKTQGTRDKQALTLRLTFARKKAEGISANTSGDIANALPSDVKAALKLWRESTDTSVLAAEREIIERHIEALLSVSA